MDMPRSPLYTARHSPRHIRPHRKYRAAPDHDLQAPIGRRLLQTKALPSVVDSYSAAVAAGADGAVVGGILADTWLQGPWGWPPRFDYWNQNKAGTPVCSAGSALLDLVGTVIEVRMIPTEKLTHVEIVVTPISQKSPHESTSQLTRVNLSSTPQVLAEYYTGAYAEKYRFNLPNTTVAASMPRVTLPPAGNLTYTSAAPAPLDWVVLVMEWLGDTVLLPLGITPGSVEGFFTSIPEQDTVSAKGILKDLVRCDFEAVILCTRRRGSIFISLVLSYVLYLGIDIAVLKPMGLGGLSTFVFVSVPSIAMYNAYGYSPGCFPAIPACLLTDIIASVYQFLPMHVTFPNALQRYPGCVTGNASNFTLPKNWSNATDGPMPAPGTPDCFRGCHEAPLSFTGWERSLAWVLCGVDPLRCADILRPFPGAWEQAIEVSQILLGGDEDLVSACTFCFYATLCKSVPYLLLLIAILYGIVALVQLPFVMISAMVSFLVQIVAYTHTGGGGDE